MLPFSSNNVIVVFMDVTELVLSHLLAEQERMQKTPDLRFVHYTSADTAKQILENKQVWMRNTSVMNDYAEIKHGETAVRNFFNFSSESSATFWRNLEERFPRISKEIDVDYSNWANDLNWNTFVTSVSVHHKHENFHGRLSMWRAYGQSTGVALIFKPDIFFTEDSKINAFSYPVLYWNEERVLEEFEGIVHRFQKNLHLFNDDQREDIKFWIKEMFHSFAFSLKHPGFAEEQEWRVVYRPNSIPSEVITKAIKTINGVPQTIYQIPLDAEWNTGISQILDRVIIGPSQHAWEIRDAFLGLLANTGMDDLNNRVVVSGIPLRT